MKDSDIIKELIVNAYGVREDQMELFARAIRAEMRQEKLPEAPITEAAASEPKGRGGAEKRAVFERLRDFRDRNGLGCLRKIVNAANGAVTEDALRSMLVGTPYPIAKWRVVEAALTQIEGAQDK